MDQQLHARMHQAVEAGEMADAGSTTAIMCEAIDFAVHLMSGPPSAVVGGLPPICAVRYDNGAGDLWGFIDQTDPDRTVEDLLRTGRGVVRDLSHKARCVALLWDAYLTDENNMSTAALLVEGYELGREHSVRIAQTYRLHNGWVSYVDNPLVLGSVAALVPGSVREPASNADWQPVSAGERASRPRIRDF